ncbi:hypothetical protein [Frigidibacter sp. MR17.24]|uniref:hypothetical protein n=1 Tax=Frigidibacter sp. MR17.24 TaxID=3127345 RepID=UPI003012E259
MKPAIALIGALFLAAAGPQAAVSDLVLAPGVFAALPVAQPVAFRHARTGGEGALDETLQLTHRDGGGLVIAGKVPVAEFGLGSANPIALYFFESVVRTMARESGGSPFYIRNRMREALARAPLSGPEVVLSPFETDPNRDRMGEWGALTLTIRTDAAAPGGLRSLTAETAGGYREVMEVTGT